MSEVIMQNAEYQRHSAVSNSSLKLFIDDPGAYRYKYESGRTWVEESKPEFDFGEAVHQVVLLGDRSNLALIPSSVLSKSGSRSGNAWKEWSSENKDKIQLKQKDYDRVMRCVDSVHEHPVAGPLLALPGRSEHSFFFDDKLLGIETRCRVDRLTNCNKIIDLKTCEQGVQPRHFVRQAANFKYHYQEYFYRRVFSGLDLDVDDFLFVAVAKNEPFDVAVHRLGDEFLSQAQEVVERFLAALAERRNNNDWTLASEQTIFTLQPQNFVRYQEEYAV